MNEATWDLDELNQEAAEHTAAADTARRGELLQEATMWGAPRGRRLPTFPVAAPAPVSGPETPAALPSATWLREVRLARKEGLLTRREARDYLDLPPRWWQRGE